MVSQFKKNYVQKKKLLEKIKNQHLYTRFFLFISQFYINSAMNKFDIKISNINIIIDFFLRYNFSKTYQYML